MLKNIAELKAKERERKARRTRKQLYLAKKDDGKNVKLDFYEKRNQKQEARKKTLEEKLNDVLDIYSNGGRIEIKIVKKFFQDIIQPYINHLNK